jgi:hypothetical protein
MAIWSIFSPFGLFTAIRYIALLFGIFHCYVFGIFYGYLVYFSRFGMFFHDKSGNPELNDSLQEKCKKVLPRNCASSHINFLQTFD